MRSPWPAAELAHACGQGQSLPVRVAMAELVLVRGWSEARKAGGRVCLRAVAGNVPPIQKLICHELI